MRAAGREYGGFRSPGGLSDMRLGPRQAACRAVGELQIQEVGMPGSRWGTGCP